MRRKPREVIDVMWTYDEDGRVYVRWDDIRHALRLAVSAGVTLAAFNNTVSQWVPPPDPDAPAGRTSPGLSTGGAR